jgi:hypothetical protein
MQFDKHALILAVVEGLNLRGSWTGKTHVQKALFLMDAAGLLKAPFHFVLYKHGPFTIDFETELEQMKSYAALKSDTVEGWYGVRLSPGTNAPMVKQVSPLPVATLKAVELICQFVGRKGVVDLEPLSTAVWIRTREGVADADEVAARLHQLKPHVALPDAENADRESLRLFESAQNLLQTRQR